ncbi:SDR family NAD(P)-dependent oxidoreductase [Rhizobium lusitanum]|uniref:SDR family NAD(P)-dependent oxidoreductase n=1 Tax=Rhizobium lusitanum TaxID=293958 RepID=UPI00157416EB|nr:SDR family NAD(P)-dependent oxidoreductase [Rhizobium lusitanum]NTJ11792.1 SDR family oxidoreductase [Rhizobium lusitanum]
MKDLSGRTALITGGARGLGAAAARSLASRGARVVLADLLASEVESAAESMRAEGIDAVAIALDVSNRDQCNAVAASVRVNYGKISILVNSAGIVGYTRVGDAESPRDWDQLIGVNLTGSFNVLYAVLPDLKETEGTVVNIASVAAFTSGFGHSGYTASKGGIVAFTKAMCRELSGFGIRCNAVAPGYVATEGMGGKGNAMIEDWLQFHVPMKRHGRPEEVGSVIAFLCSNEASFVNGVTIPVDGGYLSV